MTKNAFESLNFTAPVEITTNDLMEESGSITGIRSFTIIILGSVFLLVCVNF